MTLSVSNTEPSQEQIEELFALYHEGEYLKALSHSEVLAKQFPDYPLFQNFLGAVNAALGRFAQAVTNYGIALQLNPDLEDVHNNLGLALNDLGKFENAITSYQNAIKINPDYAEAYSNLGDTLDDMGNFEEASVNYQRALEINPSYVKAYNNLGTTLYDLRKIDASEKSYDRALELNPDYAEAHYNRSHVWLLQGKFEQGWTEYESRFQLKNDPGFSSHPSTRWRGESLKEKTLLLLAEQGIGDEVMFCSCLTDLCKDLFGAIILLCDERLQALFSRSFPDVIVLAKGHSQNPIEVNSSIDLHCAMGSLPGLFRNSLNNFPRQKSYLVPDPSSIKKWQDRYSKLDNKITIGISWRGGTTKKEKMFRSIDLSKWRDIFGQKANFVNLQYGQHEDEKSNVEKSTGIQLHQWQDANPLTDLDNFTAQIAALDLVISIDNSTVHIAGSVGVETWILLPFNSNWRWLLDCEDSPWYASVRLFRQQEREDWDEVLKRVSVALSSRCTENET